MEEHLNLHDISARKFIDVCKDKFGWSDLSNDVIMDVGCGHEGFCGKSLLEKFPDAGTIIGIDKNPQVAQNFKLRTTTKIECAIADIEKRETLQKYEGRMTKVLSTRVFHQLMDKEEAFRNVYYVLKPGGEAGILFVLKSIIYDWLTEKLKNPKWKDTYQFHYIENMYKCGGPDYFKEMAEKIGFRVLECSEEKIVIPYPSDELCKEVLHIMCGNWFKIPPETLEEFKEESLQIFLELSGRDSEGRPCYRSTELHLLLVKPTEGSGSELKKS